MESTLLVCMCCALAAICGLAEGNATATDDIPSSNATNVNITIAVTSLPCKLQVEFDPEEYEQFENGSVYIPAYKRQLDIEDYEMFNRNIVVCLWNMNYSKEFIECETKLVYGSDEYITFKNGSIYIEPYDRLYDLRNHFKLVNASALCQPPESKHSPDYVFIYVSTIATGISIFCLVLHLIVFCIVPDIRNLPGYCLASLCVALLLAYICFSNMSAPPESCAGIAVSVYYFFLASFFWMNTISFELTRILWRASTKLRPFSNTVDWKRFSIYSLYSWLTPLVLVSASLIVDKSNSVPDDYRPHFGKGVCWFNKGKALLVFFGFPQFAIIIVNLCFFIFSAVVIQRHRMRNKDNTKYLVKNFALFMRLAVIMGLGWILGLVAGYVDEVPLWYIFVIINALQGLFIFLSFSFNKKVINHFRQIRSLFFPMKPTPSKPTSVNSTSTTEGGSKGISLSSVTAGKQVP